MLEDILERRKDTLYKTSIIPHLPPPATKIIKIIKIPKKVNGLTTKTQRHEGILF
jgi:hypothetical protein